MLVVANGAYKSGSVWLREIVLHMGEFNRIPADYAARDTRNPGVMRKMLDRRRLPAFLEEVDFSSQDYLAKNHFSSEEQRDLLLSHPDVRVLDIDRDVRDVVVSYYYDQKRVRDLPLDFDKYYWLLGRYRAVTVLHYHDVWDCGSDQVYVASFERLKTDFYDEVRAIGEFLGRDLSDDDLAQIRERTTLEALREKFGGDPDDDQGWFRKGETGDWTNHLSKKMARDVERLKEQGLVGPLEKGWYRCLKGVRAVHRTGRRLRTAGEMIGKDIV